MGLGLNEAEVIESAIIEKVFSEEEEDNEIAGEENVEQQASNSNEKAPAIEGETSSSIPG